MLTGVNGSGKSSIARAIAGVGELSCSGEITFAGEDISALPANERACRGIFLSAQEPVEIPGLTVAEMLRSALEARGEKLSYNDFQLRIADACEKLELNPFFAQRELNVKMSGGEKKKCEILQMLVLRPKLVILDEIDSGLDMKSARKISKILADYQRESGASFLIISHNLRINESLTVDKWLKVSDGSVVKMTTEEVDDALSHA